MCTDMTKPMANGFFDYMYLGSRLEEAAVISRLRQLHVSIPSDSGDDLQDHDFCQVGTFH